MATNKGQRFIPETVETSDFRDMLASCGDTVAGTRDKAALVTIFRTGLRSAEACSIRLDDIYPKRNQILVREGKGKKTRRIGYDDSINEYLSRWLNVRSRVLARKGIQSNYLFCTNQGKKLATSHLRRKIKELQRKASVLGRVHLHGLRHTLASQLLEEGIGLGVIQRQLGHARSSTTERYLHEINPRLVSDTMKKRSFQWNEPEEDSSRERIIFSAD